MIVEKKKRSWLLGNHYLDDQQEKDLTDLMNLLRIRIRGGVLNLYLFYFVLIYDLRIEENYE